MDALFLNFVLGVASSLLATLLLLLTATWRSKTVRYALTAITAAMLRIDTKYVFANIRDAEPEIHTALKKAAHVRVFTGRGNEFQHDLYVPVLQGIHTRKLFVQVLLPDPVPRFQGVDWIDYREKEIATFDKGFGQGTTRRQIENNVQFLRAYIEPGTFEVRTYHAPHFGRYILTEHFLFLTPYKSTLHSKDCPVIQYGRGDMYDMFDRLFTMQWNDSPTQTAATRIP